MKKPFVFVFSVIFSMTVAIPIVEAAGQGKGRQKQQKQDKAAVTVIFGKEDRRIINQYYRGNTSNLPPGLAKRGGNLPPGLQKQLRRNGQLPPGLEKRIEPFPYDLERRLPGIPPIYRRGTIGNRAVIYDPMTNTIMDILQILGM